MISFFDGYMHYTMNDIETGDYVFANSIDIEDNEEINIFVVSDTSELNDNQIVVEADHEMTPVLGDGIICRNDGTSFLPTSLDGLSQQLIDYARNIDLNIFAKYVLEKLNTTSLEWHYENDLSYFADTEIELSNEGTNYSITVPEKGTLRSVSFKLTDIGEAESIDETTDAYTITVDFDVNQTFTPKEEFSFDNNNLSILGLIPEVTLMSIEGETFEVCDVAYPTLVNYHTLQFKFISTVKTDENTLIAKLVF